MRSIYSITLMSFLLIFSFPSLATESNNKKQSYEEYQNDINQLKQDAKFEASDIDILRRDQVNYKIEKDLLKETYSSNLQSINVVITIVFGVFGVIGYLGMRSIKEIKNDYTSELNNLRELKTKFESELTALNQKQTLYESQITRLSEVNQTQDNRLKVLELIEKISTLIQQQQWFWALKWISAGLEMDSNNVILLTQKAVCHSRLGEISSTIASRKLLLNLEPENMTAKLNLLEALALGNQLEEFNKLYAQFKGEVDQQYGGKLIVYLTLLLNLISGNLNDAIKGLNEIADKYPTPTTQTLAPWGFDEALAIASKLPDGNQKDLLLNTVQFFQGKLTSGDLKTILQGLK